MNIQWYPGHMTKTRRQMAEDLKFVDLVAEVVDARIPISSRNPDIDTMVGSGQEVCSAGDGRQDRQRRRSVCR